MAFYQTLLSLVLDRELDTGQRTSDSKVVIREAAMVDIVSTGDFPGHLYMYGPDKSSGDSCGGNPRRMDLYIEVKHRDESSDVGYGQPLGCSRPSESKKRFGWFVILIVHNNLHLRHSQF